MTLLLYVCMVQRDSARCVKRDFFVGRVSRVAGVTTDMGEHEMSNAARLYVVFEPEVRLQGGQAAR